MIDASREEIAWLAGILEGEGHFPVQRRTIVLRMCDEDIVKRVQKIFQRRITTIPRKNPKHSTIYHLTVCGDRAVEIMELILPYMGERRSARINSSIRPQKLPKPHVKRKPYGTVKAERMFRAQLVLDELGDSL